MSIENSTSWPRGRRGHAVSRQPATPGVACQRFPPHSPLSAGLMLPPVLAWPGVRGGHISISAGRRVRARAYAGGRVIMQADFDELAKVRDDLAHGLQNQHNARAKLCFAPVEPLLHLIDTGCDVLLMPSMQEPCGLPQMSGAATLRKTGRLPGTPRPTTAPDDGARAPSSTLRRCVARRCAPPLALGRCGSDLGPDHPPDAPGFCLRAIPAHGSPPRS